MMKFTTVVACATCLIGSAKYSRADELQVEYLKDAESSAEYSFQNEAENVQASDQLIGAIQVDFDNFKAQLKARLSPDGSRIEKFLFIDQSTGKPDELDPAKIRAGVPLFELLGNTVLELRSKEFNAETGGAVEFIFSRRVVSGDVRKLPLNLKRMPDGQYKLFTNDGKPEAQFTLLKAYVTKFLGVPTGIDRLKLLQDAATVRNYSSESLPRGSFAKHLLPQLAPQEY